MVVTSAPGLERLEASPDVGLKESVINAIASGELPDLESDEEAYAYDLTWQLAHKHRIDGATYEAAARAFGDKGLVDIVLLAGLYMTTCSIINAFEVPVPEDDATAPSAR